MNSKTPLYVPSEERIKNSNMTSFINYVNSKFGINITAYEELYNWSIADIPNFWKAIWDFGEFKFSKGYGAIVTGDDMISTKWFTSSKLNFSENMLRYRDSRTALISVKENAPVEKITYEELYDRVASLAKLLRELGVKKGDRVAAFITNIPEAVIGMLATASIGAVWSSCSPDFGFQGVIDRFEQIRPKVLIAINGYSYNGKYIDCEKKIERISESIPSIEKIILIGGDSNQIKYLTDTDKYLDYNVLEESASSTIEFEQVDFDHPIYIMYSSGTTGKPKCIVHGIGGTLIQHYKELFLHIDLKREDVITFFTTCGWMMWNWLVSSLNIGAAILLYDGSPVYPTISTLWNLIDEYGVTIFGTSPKYLSICQSSDYNPKLKNKLKSLRTILSTGSPLSKENYNWIYENVKREVLLSSISGGTDIISCFMLGNPLLPVFSEEIQCRGLGMKVEVFNEKGESIVAKRGELVCTAPFPSMPVYFWNDPDNKKYRSAYFEHYPGIWRHGDYVLLTERGSIIVFGRSDATLNPGGVRIGTAEIYNVVENLDEVADSLVIGQNWKDDVRIVLFVVLNGNKKLTDELIEKIRSQIKINLSPRHLPSKVIQVQQIPRTLNLKKVEVTVSRLINGQGIDNKEALINPESLRQFYNLDELKTD